MDVGRVIVRDKTEEVPSTITVHYRYDKNDNWMIWNGFEVGQVNPLFTNEDDTYSFLLTEGEYYLTVSKPGFRTRKSNIFKVEELSLVSEEVELYDSVGFLDNLFYLIESFNVVPKKISEIEFDQNLLTGVFSQNLNEFRVNTVQGIRLLSEIKSNNKAVVVFWSDWTSETSLALNELDSVGSNQIFPILLDENLDNSESLISKGGYALNSYSLVANSQIEKWGVKSSPQYIFLDEQGFIKEIIIGKVLETNQILDRLK